MMSSLGSRVARRASAAVSSRMKMMMMSTEAAAGAAPESVKLNFVLPHETIYNEASVHSVIVPGVEGEYGVTAGHVAYVAQLKPGVLKILHQESASAEDAEQYFVAGGYAMTHPDSTTVRRLFCFVVVCL